MAMNKRIMLRTAFGFLIAVVMYWPVLTSSQGQTSVDIPVQEINSHRIGRDQMIHAVRPSGIQSMFEQVTLQVIVTPLGKVESAKATDGPSEFFDQAEKIEMEREFKPFSRDGVAIRASIEDSVFIVPPEEWAMEREFHSLAL